ncbi:MAG TPA: glycosyltransferase family 9 protein [Longimicrobiaceae bacterium]
MRGNRLYKSLDRLVGQLGVLALAPFSRRTSGPAVLASPRRVLVVKLAALGDTVLLVPAVRALRERFPDAEVTLVCTGVNEAAARLYPGCFDRILRLEVGRALREPAYLLDFVRGLRALRFDVVFDFEQWPYVSPILLRLAGIPVRVGFRTGARTRHLLYTHVRERRGDRHEAENFLHLLGAVGIEPPAPVLELPVAEEARRDVVEGLRADGWNGEDPLVVVHPGCGSHGFPREWPLASYEALCTRLLAAGEAFFVFTGGPDERHLTGPLAAALGGRGTARTELTLERFAALVSLARLVVSGNTGAMHLAAAAGVPQVALHGPTDSAKWGPLNPRAVVIRSSCPECPCLDLGHEFHRTDGFCMAQIPVDEVYRAAVAALGMAASHAA